MPKVSIIVPNYNHARFLPLRMETIFNQTYQDFEVILLDDCSTDKSMEILQEYAKNPKVSHFVVNKRNSGSPFKQWDKGTELATGEYVWIAESDDCCENDFLDNLVSILNSNLSTGLAFCGSNWIDEKNEIGPDLSLHHEDFTMTGRDEILKYLVFYNNIQNVSACLIRKKFIKKESDYLKFRSCGDWIFYVSLLSDSDIYFSARKLNSFRWYHENVSNVSAKSGLWVIEGINVLNTVVKYIKIPYCQRITIAKHWLRRISELSINKSKFKYLKLYLKIFKFCLSTNF